MRPTSYWVWDSLTNLTRYSIFSVSILSSARPYTALTDPKPPDCSCRPEYCRAFGAREFLPSYY